MPLTLTDAKLAEEFLELRPFITTWSRLEPLPTTEDLSVGLRAGVADPLWLLHRQQAFQELRGEDAGTPIDVRLEGRRGTVTRFHAGPPGADAAERAVDTDGLHGPLEVVVEREDVGDHPRHAAAAGAHLLRMLTAAGLPTKPFTETFPVVIEAPSEPMADQAGALWHAVLDGRGLDGAAMAAATRPHRAADGSIASVPGELEIAAADADQVRAVLADWLQWYESLLGTPTSAGEPAPAVPDTWLPNRQEYAFALALDLGDGEIVLRADQYVDGHLDWYDFVASPGPSLGARAAVPEAERVRLPATIPAPVRYPGMPADRLWEFEDARVNLGGLDTGRGDLGRMLLAEFGLVYGNDWFVVPVELAVGSVFKVDRLVVRDTFGHETPVGPSVSRSGAPWEMFELSSSMTRGAEQLQELFFLPPVVARRFESEPLEEVRILRDEMANLVWGVERQIPGTSGEPYDRALASTRTGVRQELDADHGDAQLVYRLQTPVPDHWIPFAPVAVGEPDDPAFDVRLQRRALLRTLPDETVELHPLGRILRTDPGVAAEDETPLELEDEEAVREGIVVRRSFQYTRWTDGSVHSWVGRSKRTGRGEGHSGLRFDTSDKR